MATHTYALMNVTRETYEEIKAHLQDSGYDHAIMDRSDSDGVALDMHGIALVNGEEERRNPEGKDRRQLDLTKERAAAEHAEERQGNERRGQVRPPIMRAGELENALKEFEATQLWSKHASDAEKLLVDGNLKAFVAHLRKKYGIE